MTPRLPNLLTCHKCPWQVPDDGRILPARCPECGKVVRVRCGQPKRAKHAPGGTARELCRQLVARGAACRRHCGNGRAGVDHKSYVHGGRSRYVPARYLAAHGLSMAEPLAQREMRHEIALLDAMIEEASARIGESESGRAWEALGAVVENLRGDLQDLRSAVAMGDSEAATDLSAALMARLQDDLFPVVADGLGEENARAEVARLTDVKARLVKVQQSGEDSVPIVVLRTFQSRIAVILRDRITDDPELLLAIVNDIRREAIPGWNAIPRADELVKRVASVPVVDLEASG